MVLCELTARGWFVCGCLCVDVYLIYLKKGGNLLQKFSLHASRLGIPSFEISMSKKNKKRH
jgi:hypothetical protein